MKRMPVALALTTFLLAACGVLEGDPTVPPGGGDPGVIAPDDPVTIPPEPGSDVHNVGGRPERVRPRPGMADVRPVPWEKARQTPSGRSLRITYWTGVEPCNVLDHVDVKYSSSNIEVTLYQGHDPDAADVACIEIALRKVVRVPLDEAVRGRKIVDGAKS